MHALSTRLEQPLSVDISGSGCIAVLDQDGERIVLSGRDPETLDRPARACRFFDEHPLLLFDDGLLKTPTGERQGGAGPTDFAVAPSGSVYVIAAGVLERVGELPLRHAIEGTALATATGGVWVCGERAVLLRPVRSGLDVHEEHDLPSPARAAAVGPDGALYVLLDGGLWRDGDVLKLDERLVDIAAAPGVLVGCGPSGFVDLTHLVPPPDDGGPRFDLPSCDA